VVRGSNPRHSPCKGDALPAELTTHEVGFLQGAKLTREGAVFQPGGLSGADILQDIYTIRTGHGDVPAADGRRAATGVNIVLH
jgi:hypothetical protein